MSIIDMRRIARKKKGESKSKIDLSLAIKGYKLQVLYYITSYAFVCDHCRIIGFVP